MGAPTTTPACATGGCEAGDDGLSLSLDIGIGGAAANDHGRALLGHEWRLSMHGWSVGLESIILVKSGSFWDGDSGSALDEATTALMLHRTFAAPDAKVRYDVAVGAGLTWSGAFAARASAGVRLGGTWGASLRAVGGYAAADVKELTLGLEVGLFIGR